MSRSDEGHIYASAKIDGCLREPSGWGFMPEGDSNHLHIRSRWLPSSRLGSHDEAARVDRLACDATLQAGFG